MPNYFRLEQDLRKLNVLFTQDSHEWEPLDAGRAMSPNTQPPFLYKMEADEDEPGVAHSQLPDFDSVGPIFSKKLVEVIQEAGAVNLEVFPAVVTDMDSDEEIDAEYAAVNVVGLVPCADIEQPNSEPLAGHSYFSDLEVSPDEESELLIFRLAEQPTDIIVHEKLAKLIKAAKPAGVILEPTSLNESSMS